MRASQKLILIAEHLPASLFVGTLFYLLTQDILHFMVAIVFGWLLDADHAFDYLMWVRKNKIKLSVSDFLSGLCFRDGSKIYILLHSVEITVACILLFLSTNCTYFLCASAAHSTHLVQDFVTHKPRSQGYFLIARASNNFCKNWFCKHFQ